MNATLTPPIANKVIGELIEVLKRNGIAAANIVIHSGGATADTH